MKTAISLPQDDFRTIERAAADLGMNRSEFFTKGALLLASQNSRASLVEQINQALDAETGLDEDTEALVSYSIGRLADESW
jgi:hypothetical protein